MTRHLITSALPYINGVKHLGNLAGSLLPADVYARTLRRAGEKVLFICATDEHGTPAELSALEAGESAAAYCSRMHETQARIYRQLGLSFDWFGRSSSPENHALTQQFYRDLKSAGYIETREIQQVYSIHDRRFLPDRYIVGTCPRCGYTAARGDQCENCTTLLDPTDLIDPRSAVFGSSALEIRPTKHLFLRLDALQPQIHAWVEQQKEYWPPLTSSIAEKWLAEGLRERCITRDLSWGVPVPEPGFEGKVFYVWFDAPVAYIGATQQWAANSPQTRNWESWWRGQSDVEYTQFLAKDNVPFHTVFWPGMQLGCGEPWTLASQIKSFHWLNYYGGKFSTSQKRGVFLDDALQAVPADTWRYFLLARAPESDDSSFTWEDFASTVNKDLVGIFGNFVNRTLRLTAQHFGQQVPPGGTSGPREAQLTAECAQAVSEYVSHLRQCEFRRAIMSLRGLWALGNLYLDQTAPWTLVKHDKDAGAAVLRTAIDLIRLFAVVAHPVIPFTCELMFESLQLKVEERNASFERACNLGSLEAGRSFSIPPLLFQRIEREQVALLKQQFGAK